MWQDLRYAVRTLAKSPGFTVVAIIALTLGIGANTAMFSILNRVLLRPMPYRDGGRLVRLYETYLPHGEGSVSALDFVDWREQNHTFDGIAAYHTVSRNLQNVADPERIPAVEASANLFELLGSKPLLGRTFLPDEDQAGRPPVAIISERLWRGRFASDPAVVGKVIVLDGQQHTVAGVMPREFEFPMEAPRAELWVPLYFNKPQDKNRGSHSLFVVGRLKGNVDLKLAQQDMDAIGRRLAEQYETNDGRGVKIRSLAETVVGDVRPTLLLLMGAVGFVLLIACANVANLLLARAASRKKELAVRAALGAGRGRLARQFLTESLLLALAGGMGGLLVALWGADLLVALSGDQLPRLDSPPFDYRVFGFLLLACLLTGILFGVAPALAASRTNLLDSLQEGRTGGGRGQRKFRSVLVVAETALALILLVGAGLLMKTFLSMMSIGPGFVAENVLTMQVALPAERYPKGTASTRFYQPVQDRVLSIPGVRAAGWTLALPLQTWGINGDFGIEGFRPERAAKAPFAEFREISPGYFRAMGIPILRGRDFGAEDGQESHLAAIVNEALAKRYYKGKDPIGKRVEVWRAGWATIVGVAGNVRQSKLNRGTVAEIYVPHRQLDLAGLGIPMSLVVASAKAPPETLTGAIRAAVREVDPDQPIYNVKTMERVVAESVSDRRLYLSLFGAFAAIAVALAAAGIYGVMSYLVTQRTQEIGIRLALGAQQSSIARLVVGQGLWMGLVGVALGVAGALALNRLLIRLLYGVKATDPGILIGACLLLVGVASAASYVPARRAMKLDPIETLKHT